MILQDSSIEIESFDGYGYLAHKDCKDFLIAELNYILPDTKITAYDDLILCDGKKKSVYWAKTIIENPLFIKFKSIGEAAQILKNIQRNWALYPYASFRRSQLIKEKLPYINTKEKKFPFTIPSSPMGFWTLIDDNTMLVAPVTSSSLPLGELFIQEDHENPPSRAYLKLQEALIRCGKLPQTGEKCLDVGASPGGWTWVLRSLGAEVTAVDRAELSKELMNDSLVHYIKHDAFTLKPEELGSFDWVFSDVICYPSRLLEWVEKWIELDLCRNMVCTIKIQGNPDWEIINKFASIPHSTIIHLEHNKHELTWIYLK